MIDLKRLDRGEQWAQVRADAWLVAGRWSVWTAELRASVARALDALVRTLAPVIDQIARSASAFAERFRSLIGDVDRRVRYARGQRRPKPRGRRRKEASRHAWVAFLAVRRIA